MRIAFVTPTLHTLGANWRRDPQIVKLAAPTLSGALRSQGYKDIRQYDFEVQVFDLERRRPGLVDLRAFFDDGPVDAYLRDEEPGVVHEQVEILLDALQVEEADLFAFSCASTIGIYADMHANSNVCVALIHGIKKRFPRSTTVFGGMQISPDDLQAEEYRMLLRRCSSLDFTAEGVGEYPMLQILWHMSGEVPLVPGKRVEQIAQGLHLHRGSGTKARLPKEFAMQDKVLPKTYLTPDLEDAEGDHERAKLDNISIRVTPWFDPKNIELRKLTGTELLERYHLGPEWSVRLAPHLSDRVAVLPYIFLEGCNARCAFCSYSMTALEKQDLDQVIRSLHWMVETYGVRYFHFLNTNINGSLKYCEAFCDAIIESGLDIRWSDCANLWALNDRVMDKLRQSGCIRLTFGLECPSPRMLKYILKGIDIETAHQRLQRLDQLGIWNHLLLITGLPTETEEDSRHFVDFLERSRDYVHGYSISSFYLIKSSLMGMFPERFGLIPRRNESGLLEDSAFDELGGLTWEEKEHQIVHSTQRIQRVISELKQDPKYTSGAIDLELLFWLYDRLGHDAKPDIVRAYEAAFLDTPNHTRHLAAPVRDLIGAPTMHLRAPLEGLRLPVRNDAIRFDGRDVVVPFASPTNDLELRLSMDGEGHDAIAIGHRVRAKWTHTRGIDDVCARVFAAQSPLLRFLDANGWGAVDGAPSPSVVRVSDGAATVELQFQTRGPDRPAFATGDRHAMSFRVVDGVLADAAKAKRLFRIFATKALELLDRAGGEPLDIAAVERVARALVDELEAPYVELWQSDPNFQGFRHGDRYSRVAPSSPTAGPRPSGPLHPS